MSTLTHNYFGELDFRIEDDMEYIWEKEINGIETRLWYVQGAEYSAELLDKFADFFKNLTEKIAVSREVLTEYLNEDSEYMDFHIEEIEDNNFPTNVNDFVSAMEVTGVALWINDDDSKIIIDFMIAPEESDQILCVKFNPQGEVLGIAWES